MRFDSRRPMPLVPRALVREVRGRIAADGGELEPLDESDVLAAARELAALGVEIAVVAFIHSYRNPGARTGRRAPIVQRNGVDAAAGAIQRGLAAGARIRARRADRDQCQHPPDRRSAMWTVSTDGLE